MFCTQNCTEIGTHLVPKKPFICISILYLQIPKRFKAIGAELRAGDASDALCPTWGGVPRDRG